MSYILEALRKSERERQGSDRAAELLDLPLIPLPQPAARSRHVPYLGMGLAALAIGILVGWWQPWRLGAPPEKDTALLPGPVARPQPAPEAVSPAAQPASRAEALREVQTLVARPEASSTAPAARSAPAAPAPQPAAVAQPAPTVPSAPPAPAPQPVAVAQPAPAASAAPPAESAPAAPAEKAAAPAPEASPPKREQKAAASGAKEREKKADPAHQLPPPPDRVLTLAELPQPLREGLPTLSTRGFVYSDDSQSRMVVINDRMLLEGDELAPGLKLERIEPDGAVLSYKGYRFLAPR